MAVPAPGALAQTKPQLFAEDKPNGLGEQGWHTDENIRVPPMWPGFKSQCQRHMWVEFVVGPLPCCSVGTPVFCCPQKPILHFQIPIRQGIRSTNNLLVDVLHLNRYLFI